MIKNVLELRKIQLKEIKSKLKQNNEVIKNIKGNKNGSITGELILNRELQNQIKIQTELNDEYREIRKEVFFNNTFISSFVELFYVLYIFSLPFFIISFLVIGVDLLNKLHIPVFYFMTGIILHELNVKFNETRARNTCFLEMCQSEIIRILRNPSDNQQWLHDLVKEVRKYNTPRDVCDFQHLSKPEQKIINTIIECIKNDMSDDGIVKVVSSK